MTVRRRERSWLRSRSRPVRGTAMTTPPRGDGVEVGGNVEEEEEEEEEEILVGEKTTGKGGRRKRNLERGRRWRQAFGEAGSGSGEDGAEDEEAGVVAAGRVAAMVLVDFK
ncbi:hypothetical protein TIFTF001_012687 [Ficus carica]|uniref:Uncharacterized protein n=1 Tax=Ficus carica TaxID=3494 RepID=A0AA88A0F2_FICCA|nr:hypothetical protein TIFTF001_012687 [Ficus carica]